MDRCGVSRAAALSSMSMEICIWRRDSERERKEGYTELIYPAPKRDSLEDECLQVESLESQHLRASAFRFIPHHFRDGMFGSGSRVPLVVVTQDNMLYA